MIDLDRNGNFPLNGNQVLYIFIERFSLSKEHKFSSLEWIHKNYFL
jgi:hypothetical protein